MHRILACILLFLSFNSNAQSWRVFPTTDSVLNLKGDTLLYKPRFDSLIHQANYTEYYLEEGIDQRIPVYDSCTNAFGPSVIGTKIVESPQELLFIFAKDTIRIQRRQNLSFNLYRGDTVLIHYLGVSLINLNGFGLDSMETYSIQIPPSARYLNTSSNLEIKLSKNFGLWSFPGVFRASYDSKVSAQLNRSQLDIPTRAQVFNYEVGDEFHYFLRASYLDNLGFVEEIMNHWILGKSVDSSNARIEYTIRRRWQREGLSPDLNWVVEPIKEDTILSLLQNCFDPIVNKASYKLVNANTYYLVNPLGSSFQDPCVQILTGPKWVGNDSCFNYGFDPKTYRTNYALALGETYDYISDCESGNCYEYERRLIYYKKNGQSVGDPQYLGFDQLAFSNFQIYPNPAKDYFSIIWDSHLTEVNSIYLRELSGRLIKQIQVQEAPFRCEVQELKPGSYILQIVHDSGSETRPILIQ